MAAVFVIGAWDGFEPMKAKVMAIGFVPLLLLVVALPHLAYGEDVSTEMFSFLPLDLYAYCRPYIHWDDYIFTYKKKNYLLK